MFDKFKIKIFELPGFEADDLIGTLATRLKGEQDLQIVILSGDRDLLQLVEGDKVVCHMLQPSGGDTTYYNEAKVMEKYGLKPRQIIDLKGLIGDSSDNFPGLAGVGEKTATPLLQEFETVEGIYDNLVIVAPKTAKKFEGQLETALKFKKLATIECNAPIFLDSLDDLRAVPLDKEALKYYFNEMGFVSLIKRL
jgi:DNA polymerase-1